jgi:signal transduction histidine kinase
MRMKTPKVLLVDDEPPKLRLLQGMLAPQGYDLRAASDGETALAMAAAVRPDLVLVDAVMPGFSGIEVCRRLRSDRATAFVPVMLVTSLSDRESRDAVLEAGADDFLSHPLEPAEVHARAEALLRRRSFYELQHRYDELRRQEAARESLAQMIVHDLRSPLVSVIGYLELIEQGYVSGEAARDSVRVVKKSAERVVEMVTEILNVAKLEAGRMTLERAPLDIGALVSDIGLDVRPLLAQRQLILEDAIAPDLPAVYADRELIRRVLVNLVANAASFSPRGSVVRVSAEAEGARLRVRVSDSGPGVPRGDRARIFEKFEAAGRRDGRKHSTGLGLAFCKLTLEAHGGEIGVEDRGPGATFWFTLPCAEDLAEAWEDSRLVAAGA